MTKEQKAKRTATGKRKPVLKKETVKDLSPRQGAADVKGGGPRPSRACPT